MKIVSWLLLGCLISFSIQTASLASAADPVGKWELVRVETADGKSKSLPAKPKMGGAEFFKDKTVLFSDGLKGEWSIGADGSLRVILMEFLEMSGAIQGDFLRLSVDPDEILILRKQK
jgi:hypothetical protein